MPDKKITLYSVDIKSGYLGLESVLWCVHMKRVHAFTTAAIKFSTQRRWEVWMVSEADDDGNTHNELWLSRNGGASWNLARYLAQPANTIHIASEDFWKFCFLQSQRGNEEK